MKLKLRNKTNKEHSVTIRQGNVFKLVKDFKKEGVQVNCIVTSPPYWKLRSYLPDDHELKDQEFGQEKQLDDYIAKTVELFKGMRDILADDGTIWLNLGDTYANSSTPDFKAKDLCMVPFRVAIALQEDGWYVRRDIVWNKPSCMPDASEDRPGSSHEFVFLISKKANYYYDNEAVKVAISKAYAKDKRPAGVLRQKMYDNSKYVKYGYVEKIEKDLSGVRDDTRNLRDVWHINTTAFTDAHFAVMPPDLAELCILAGTSEKGHCPSCGAGWRRILKTNDGDTIKANISLKRANTPGSKTSATSVFRTGKISVKHTAGWEASCDCGRDPIPALVFDPFGGALTTALVAWENKRSALVCELYSEFIRMGKERLKAFKLKFTGALFMEN